MRSIVVVDVRDKNCTDVPLLVMKGDAKLLYIYMVPETMALVLGCKTLLDGKDDQVTIASTDLLLKAAKANCENARGIMSPDDPRMKMIDSAHWTYVLKVLGVIDKDPKAIAVKDILEKLSKKKDWKELRDLLTKAQSKNLNQKEWTKYGKLIQDCATDFARNAAHATVCTIAQFASDWAQGSSYDWVIVDEATQMTEAQLTLVWRLKTILFMLGDQKQLGPISLTKPKDNPFVKQLQEPPYVCFIGNGHPFWMLREVMRATAGLEELCSFLFYSSQLKRGWIFNWQKEQTASGSLRTRSLVVVDVVYDENCTDVPLTGDEKADAKLPSLSLSLYIYMVPETVALVLECGELDQRFYTDPESHRSH